MLDIQTPDAYGCAIDHLSFVFRSLPAVPPGYSALVEQWRRAAMSVPVNIADQSYATARGEAMECGAILDVVGLLGVVAPSQLIEAKAVLARIVGMLEVASTP